MINQEMPCPVCKKMHKRDELMIFKDVERGKVRKIVSPPDVLCDCSARLRYTVQLFCGDIYGWHWRILENNKTFRSVSEGEPLK